MSYSIRENPRARRVILKITPHGGLEVVVPLGFDRGRIPEILVEKEDWIHKTLGRFRPRTETDGSPSILPRSIHLQAIGQEYSVESSRGTNPELRLIREGYAHWRVRGVVRDREHFGKVMEPWLRHQGLVYLGPWLKRISTETGLGFERLQMRGQRSRWGSCSAKGTISLNYKLLFLPPGLVQYILVHELCHTVHLNHSPRYWALVAKFEPAYRELDRAVRSAWTQVPDWAG